MSTDATFPLAFEQVLWSSPPAFPVCWTGTTYAFTDFRLVIRRGKRTLQELPLDDIQTVHLTQNRWQRIAGTSSVHVTSGRDGSVLRLANIHHGPQLALVLQLRATELFEGKALNADFFRSALGPAAPSILRPHPGFAFAAILVFALIAGVVGLARSSSLPPIVYADNDPVAPHGDRRAASEIAAFMERDVMPFARTALGPVVGGADKVSCETCHGVDATQRNWRMPGVRALPEPELRLAGLERARLWIDPQIRNAVYGYVAEEHNQSVAGYMRQVVMPGMARLMHRPPYDFAKSYGYNRARAAVGCYHCHLVE